ncbi:TonB-dependent siderophore receptor [Novosphingobium huizhouense]|uniref:TonB-dependent siderophore receptor n=1 Tax=Novosphingobium huizhouense TaxID=2866625 RepID=UPI001CD8A89C|nr:TonB-dependent siderophore receptor [Novosphingobium huizhouense]
MQFRSSLLVTAALSALASWSASAHAEEASEAERITVIGRAAQQVSTGATGLPLTIFDTPQAVTVVDRAALDTFGLDETNEVLRYVTGVNVEQAETDRTYYNARGFDISDAMVDGIAIPNFWGPTIGAVDTVAWDSIEVIRGANAMMAGVGNPSGTINYHRRHPTGERHVSTELSAGSWGKVRGEFDLDTPITRDGRWAIRVTGAVQNADSYLRDYRSKRSVVQAVLDGQITETLKLSAAYIRQSGTSRGVLWGALPLQDAAGNQLEWDTGASTTQDWTYWKRTDQTAYGELSWEFAPGWTARQHVTRRVSDEPSRLFYVYGAPDAETGAGLYGYPGGYLSTARGWISDSSVRGTFRLLGREQAISFGAQYTDASFGYLSYPVPTTDPAWGALPGDVDSWNGTEVPYPAFGDAVVSARIKDRQWRLRAATDLSLAERLNLVLGVNYLNVRTDGFTFGVSAGRRESGANPFVGLTWGVVPGVNLYASYSGIFSPQKEISTALTPLGSAKGKSWEGGVKAQTADKALFGSIAVFRSEQSNLAEAAGFDATLGQTLYRGIDVRSTGVEAEVGGNITSNLSVQGGVTHLSIKDKGGNAVRTYVPRTTANLLVRWSPVEKVHLGAGLRWQDDVSITNALGTIRQPSYATVQLQAGYDLTENVAFNVNVANATNHKHLTSLYWDQAFYAAPRSVLGSVRLSF